MTTLEFNRWWTDFAAKLPTQASWIAGSCDRAGVTMQATLEQWAEAMRGVSLEDALDANRKLLTGDLELPKASDQLVPLIRQHAYRARGVTSEAETVDRFGRKGDQPKMANALAALLELPAGTSRQERFALLNRLLPPSSTYEPRYNCHECKDAGRVAVAHPLAIRAVLRTGTLEGCRHRTGVMRCRCQSHLPANPKRPLETYDPSQDFKIADPLWGELETERFIAWVNDRRQNYETEKYERMAWSPETSRHQQEFAP